MKARKWKAKFERVLLFILLGIQKKTKGKKQNARIHLDDDFNTPYAGIRFHLGTANQQETDTTTTTIAMYETCKKVEQGVCGRMTANVQDRIRLANTIAETERHLAYLKFRYAKACDEMRKQNVEKRKQEIQTFSHGEMWENKERENR